MENLIGFSWKSTLTSSRGGEEKSKTTCSERGEHLEATHSEALVEPEFKEFRVGDILEFTKGRRITKNEQIKGNIPYVTAATENNGIDAWIENSIFTQENIITVNFFGKCFYHPYEVAYKDGTYGAKIKDEKYQSQRHYLYITSALEKVTENVGSYSKMLTDTIAANLTITLPATSSGDPDWEYMENYIKMIEQQEKRKISNYVEHKRNNF